MDLFTVKQQYYSGNYKQALQEIEKVASSDQDAVVFYRAKSLIALGEYEKESSQSGIATAFNTYADIVAGSGSLQDLESAVSSSKSAFSLNLLASAQAIQGQNEDAVKTCLEGLDSNETQGLAELVLLAVQIAVSDSSNRSESTASSILQNFLAAHEEYANEDEIIINLAESCVNFVAGREITGSNFYFYEELCQTLPSWKSQLGLMSLHLQQSHLPEAQAIVDLLESEYYQNQQESARLYTPQLLANKITLTAMQGGRVDELRSQLLELQPEHPLCQNYKINNAKFDEVVAKYA
ncbi:coatomer subunit epsilon [Lachancea thermotolerans CBS 6340]|uniref:Coatomer subunit epsilon n=1 Tax=Lachancea thermotolerans (strain ATCC 56472 / CBS 6340 / NRRL Y-8284) TaxID=559295 RepID=C5DBT2_LACTC|nr:KLTH0A05148p [Lachancea thermotolerans CBS 6340]CAR21239.1 KLTH0A05148p [Lachancea thermotolerans CBS 6340]